MEHNIEFKNTEDKDKLYERARSLLDDVLLYIGRFFLVAIFSLVPLLFLLGLFVIIVDI